MFRSALRASMLACLAMINGAASEAVPQTLGYQGHLADSGGQPITADLSITFRLFDVQSGGVARPDVFCRRWIQRLWCERRMRVDESVTRGTS